MSEQVVQNRSLTMHENLLYDVITRQAGTPEKAVLEAVMNSSEAGATSVYIKADIDNDNNFIINIKDNGKGIISEKELTEYFETFGTPHSDNENKVWAEFRMGRGQMFAFGDNYWRTGPFSMHVDIKNLGLKYILTGNLPVFDGCEITIKFYKNPIRSYLYPSLDAFKNSIKKLIEFISVPVYFNGEQISFNPKNLKWDMEDKYAYYSFMKEGEGIKIFNMGAYVKTLCSYNYGTSGIIVSKNKLKMNFARNDIISDCIEFQEICNVINSRRKETLLHPNKKNISADERKSLLRSLKHGDINLAEVFSKKIIKTCQNKYVSLKNIFENYGKWTFAPDNNITADKIQEQGVALCLSDSNLEFLGYGQSNKDLFFEWLLNEQMDSYLIRKSENILDRLSEQYIPFYKENGYNICLSESYKQDCFIVSLDNMTTVEKRIVTILNNCLSLNNRVICIGESDVANAWTDGHSFIALNREFLKSLHIMNPSGAYTLLSVICHELAHDEETNNTHVHGEYFYENYYNLTMDYYKSPFSRIEQFLRSIKSAKISDMKEAEKNKKERIEAKRKKKLGIS